MAARRYAQAAAVAVAAAAVSSNHAVNAFAPATFSSSTTRTPSLLVKRSSSLYASSPGKTDTKTTEDVSVAKGLAVADMAVPEIDAVADMAVPEIEDFGIAKLPEEENWEEESKIVELVGLALWMGGLSGFIFANNWIGPWPSAMTQVPERIYFTGHMLGGMLFGGGVIMTTALEWLCVKNRQPAVLQFYFDKVPLLDMAVVLPGLTAAMISGTGLCIKRYGGLGIAPPHIPVVFYCLTAFAAWWAATDLATQGKAMRAVDEWVASPESKMEGASVPKIVEDRFVSNIISCGFVVALYAIMVLKPGTLPQYTPHLPNFF